MDINDPLVEKIFAALKEEPGSLGEKLSAIGRADRLAVVYATYDGERVGALRPLLMALEEDPVSP